MKRPRTLKDIENDPRVADIWTEQDGFGRTVAECYRPSYWVSLRPGWVVRSEGTHSIHEKTIREVCGVLHYSVTKEVES